MTKNDKMYQVWTNVIFDQIGELTTLIATTGKEMHYAQSKTGELIKVMSKGIDYTQYQTLTQVYFQVRNNILYKDAHIANYRQIITENKEDCFAQLDMLLLTAIDKLLRRIFIKCDCIITRKDEAGNDSMVQISTPNDLTHKECFYLVKAYANYRFRKFLQKTYCSTINNTVSIYQETYYDNEGADLSIIDMLESEASRIELDDVEFFNTIKGTLTERQQELVQVLISGEGSRNKGFGGRDLEGLKSKLFKIYNMGR